MRFASHLKNFVWKTGHGGAGLSWKRVHTHARRRNAEEILHRVHQAGRQGLGQAWLEALIWLFDFVAFWGYAIFPLTFFYPDEELYRAYLGEVYPGELVACRWAVEATGSVNRSTHPLLTTTHPPTPGHSRVMYHGGLLGDVMWTVQPLAMLGSAAIRAYLEKTLATGAPGFEIKRLLPAVAGRKRGASAAKPSSSSSSTLNRRAAPAARSPARKVSTPLSAPVASSSSSSLASPTTPSTDGGKKKRKSSGGGWSPSFSFGRTSIASRTRAGSKKAD